MPSQRPATGEVGDTVQTVGWICAFAFPMVGFVIGCLCISRGPKSEGVWMIVVSVLFALAIATFLLQAATPSYY